MNTQVATFDGCLVEIHSGNASANSTKRSSLARELDLTSEIVVSQTGKISPSTHSSHETSGWLFTKPCEKYAKVNLGSSSPNFRDENKKYLSCHDLVQTINGWFIMETPY